MAWGDLLSLVLHAMLARQFKDLARDVLEDGGHENATADTNAVSVAALLHVSDAAANWENEVTS